MSRPAGLAAVIGEGCDLELTVRPAVIRIQLEKAFGSGSGTCISARGRIASSGVGEDARAWWAAPG